MAIPIQHGAMGDGITDDTDAVSASIASYRLDSNPALTLDSLARLYERVSEDVSNYHMPLTRLANISRASINGIEIDPSNIRDVEIHADRATESDRTVQMVGRERRLDRRMRLEMTNPSNHPMRIVTDGVQQEHRGGRRWAAGEVANSIFEFLNTRLRAVPSDYEIQSLHCEIPPVLKIQIRPPIPLHQHAEGVRGRDCAVCTNRPEWRTNAQITLEVLQDAQFNWREVVQWVYDTLAEQRQIQLYRRATLGNEYQLTAIEFQQQYIGRWDYATETNPVNPYLPLTGASWHGTPPDHLDTFQAELLEAEIKRLAAAEERAKELLMEHLSPAQQESYRKYDFIRVQGQKTKREYHIFTTHKSYNVRDLQAGKTYCVQPAIPNIPFHDQLLSQLLLLKANEQLFLETANVR